jgi:Tfp pilus assembly protein PilF
LLLLAGRTEEYQQVCATMLEKFRKSDGPEQGCHAAQAYLLSASAADNPEVVLQLAKEALETHPNAGWRHRLLGMAHLRVGQCEEAIQEFHRSLESDPDWHERYLNWLGLAMAHQESGEMDEALEWYDTAFDWMTTHSEEYEQRFGSWLEGQILQREAEQLFATDDREQQDGDAPKDG